MFKEKKTKNMMGLGRTNNETHSSAEQLVWCDIYLSIHTSLQFYSAIVSDTHNPHTHNPHSHNPHTHTLTQPTLTQPQTHSSVEHLVWCDIYLSIHTSFQFYSAIVSDTHNPHSQPTHSQLTSNPHTHTLTTHTLTTHTLTHSQPTLTQPTLTQPTLTTHSSGESSGKGPARSLSQKPFNSQVVWIRINKNRPEVKINRDL